MESIVVKRATLKEIDCVSDLFDRRRDAEEGRGGRAARRESLQEAIEGQGCIALVAVRRFRGVLEYVGYAELLPTAAASGDADWELGELFVLPEARGRGVEQALLGAVTRYTRCKDARELLSEACRRDATLKPLFDALPYAGNA